MLQLPLKPLAADSLLGTAAGGRSVLGSSSGVSLCFLEPSSSSFSFSFFPFPAAAARGDGWGSRAICPVQSISSPQKKEQHGHSFTALSPFCVSIKLTAQEKGGERAGFLFEAFSETFTRNDDDRVRPAAASINHSINQSGSQSRTGSKRESSLAARPPLPALVPRPQVKVSCFFFETSQ